MILDLGIFTRRGLIVDCVKPKEGGGGVDNTWKEQRVQDQKGGERRQRGCLLSLRLHLSVMVK